VLSALRIPKCQLILMHEPIIAEMAVTGNRDYTMDRVQEAYGQRVEMNGTSRKIKEIASWK
jgi:hypothetical protein